MSDRLPITRSKGVYEARRAIILDYAILRSLGIIMGTSSDDTLIMRSGDWARAVGSGAVKLLEEGPSISPSTDSA